MASCGVRTDGPRWSWLQCSKLPAFEQLLSNLPEAQKNAFFFPRWHWTYSSSQILSKCLWILGAARAEHRLDKCKMLFKLPFGSFFRPETYNSGTPPLDCSEHPESSCCLTSPSSIFESSWIPGLQGESFTMEYQANKNTLRYGCSSCLNFFVVHCANVEILHQSSNPCLLSSLPLRDDILAFKVARNTSFLVAILVRSICRVWTRLETKNQGETAGETLPTGLDTFFPKMGISLSVGIGGSGTVASSSLDISTLKTMVSAHWGDSNS